ncbi:AAA family ATPase [Halovenus sp. WSH3]|uniref:AAA family ATPase n=2 Tax=Halovenus carboxidivorans TaxID=2692199 RepID=A0A6B0TGT0_9EURY|nr:AAA family ATPase [Halovenus carboxidivorans]
MTVIEDETPLKQEYIPEEIVGKKQEEKFLSENLEHRNLHIHGPRGTGKTHLVRKALDESEARTCYISGLKHRTQYKALQEILSQLTRDEVSSGYHTSELQRKIEEHTEVMDIVVVLDELDFLLLNDGEDLLYFLSRLPNRPKITAITSNAENLQEQLEPRTYSSLQPRRIQFEPYTGEQIYEILADRASKSLAKKSVHRNAVTYIAPSTQNAEIALTWLKTAAKNTENAVTEELVKELRHNAFEAYTAGKLEHLSQHHELLYHAVEDLAEEDEAVNAGEVYQRYQSVASEEDVSVLSDRRISDFLKQLEKLGLINADYHYGGKKGKTREIQLNRL